MMKEIKLIMFDLDGTLLNEDGHISDKNKAAIKAVRKKGVLVTLASGRGYSSMLPFALELGTEAPLVCYNGAMVQNPRDDQAILTHQGVPEKTARKAVEILRSRQIHINSYLDDMLTVENNNDHAKEYGRTKKVPYEVVNSLDEIKPFSPTKILAIDSDPDKISALKKELEEKLDAAIFRSNPNFCEILKPEIDKGWALQFLASHLNLDRDQVMAFGDQENDMGMIDKAGFGVAMGNALDKVKEIADAIAPPHHEDGVAQFLTDYFDLEIK